jgi:hypothetical protein
MDLDQDAERRSFVLSVRKTVCMFLRLMIPFLFRFNGRGGGGGYHVFGVLSSYLFSGSIVVSGEGVESATMLVRRSYLQSVSEGVSVRFG